MTTDRRSPVRVLILADDIPLQAFKQRLIEDWLGDDIPLACPLSKIEPAASLATKRKIAVQGRIGGFLANRALPPHRFSIPQRRAIVAVLGENASSSAPSAVGFWREPSRRARHTVVEAEMNQR
jgi:hypothetical protein